MAKPLLFILFSGWMALSTPSSLSSTTRCSLKPNHLDIEASTEAWWLKGVSLSGNLLAFQETIVLDEDHVPGNVPLYEIQPDKKNDVQNRGHFDLGQNVALGDNGKVAAVAFTKDDTDPDPTLMVRVFDYNESTSGWVQRGKDILAKVEFFNGLSMNGDGTIVVVRKDFSAVQVYQWNGEKLKEWKELGQPLVHGADNDAKISKSVLTLAISDRMYPEYTYRGRVQIYDFDETVSDWKRVADLRGKEDGIDFGHALAMNGDGTVLAVGEFEAPNSRGVKSAGQVEMYRRSKENGKWEHSGTLEDPMSDASSRGAFGFSVDVNDKGDLVVVGASLSKNTDGSEIAGRVFVFESNDDTDEWSLVGWIEGDDSDEFGSSVGINEVGSLMAATKGSFVRVKEISCVTLSET